MINTARHCLSLLIKRRKLHLDEKLLYYHTQTPSQQNNEYLTPLPQKTTLYPYKKANINPSKQKQQQTPSHPSYPSLPENIPSVAWKYIHSQKKWVVITDNEQTLSFLEDKLTHLLPKLYPINSETFRHFVNRHGHSKKHIEVILLHAENYNFLSDDLYNLCILRLSKVLRKPVEALQLFFELWEKDSPMLMKNSYIAALYALSDCFQNDNESRYSKTHMETLIKEMEEKGFVLDGAVFHPVVLGYLHFNLHEKIDDILATFPQQKKLSEYGKIYLSLLIAHQNDIEKAKQIYDEIQKMETDYTRKKFEPKKFLKSFNKTGQTENIKLASFNIMLRLYSEIDITQAQIFFDEVNKNTTNTTNTTDTTITTDRDTDTDTDTDNTDTDNTDNNTLQPDLVSFTTLIHKYISLAVTHYESYSTYLQINGLKKKPPKQTLEYFEKALELLNTLLTTPFSPPLHTYVSFLNASYKMGLRNELSYVLNVLKQRNSKDFDTPRFNQLSQKLKEKINIERFRDLLHYVTQIANTPPRKTPRTEQNPNPPPIDSENTNTHVQ